jgi:hypothetical protein
MTIEHVPYILTSERVAEPWGDGYAAEQPSEQPPQQRDRNEVHPPRPRRSRARRPVQGAGAARLPEQSPGEDAVRVAPEPGATAR